MHVDLFDCSIVQEDVIDFGGANLTPEANAAGATLLPFLNELET